MLETLLWPDEVRVPDFAFLEDDIEVRSQELQMAASLIDSMTVDFDPDEYHDSYREALQELVDAKIEGREVVQPEEPGEPAELTSLADAPKASLAAAREGSHQAGEVTVAAAPRAIADGANSGKKSRSAAKGAGAKSAGTRSAAAENAEAKTAEAENAEARTAGTRAKTGRGGTADAETKAGAPKAAAAKGAQRPAAKRSAKGAAAAAAQSKTRRRAS